MSISNVERAARLKLSHAADGEVLTASVPHDFTGEDMQLLGKSISEQVRRLTGNCLSGRIKVVVEDSFHVDLAKPVG